MLFRKHFRLDFFFFISYVNAYFKLIKPYLCSFCAKDNFSS